MSAGDFVGWLQENGGVFSDGTWRLEDLGVRLLSLQPEHLRAQQDSSGLRLDGVQVAFYESEWVSRGEICKSILLSRVGRFARRYVARECDLREVPLMEGRQFLDEFHLQGANRLGIIFFGLYFSDELLGLLSLGRHSRQQAADKIVLDRLCFRAGVQVLGGASRLMKRAINWAKEAGYNEIVSYSDNRWSNGNIYPSLGFKLESNLKPDYFYVKDGEIISKQSQKKATSRCPDHMTELEWAAYRGLVRVYDAGKKRWILNLWPGIHETRQEKSSKRCASQHQDGVFRHNHYRGYFWSEKNKAAIFYSSSYELRCLYLLEQDAHVAAFRRCVTFKGAEGWRNPDLWVDRIDGTSEILEVKPAARLDEPAVRFQINESQKFAASKNVGFRVWTERDSGLESDHAVIAWARDFLKTTPDGIPGEDGRAARRRERRRLSYSKQAQDKVDISCDFCSETHSVRRIAYEANIARNGVYICERRGGQIAGSRPKNHLKKVNPYAAQGQKQCSQCQNVKDINSFSIRRASWDGRNAMCGECVSQKTRAAYLRKTGRGG